MRYLKYYKVEQVKCAPEVAVAVVGNIAFERENTVTSGFTAYVTLDGRHQENQVRLVHHILGIDWNYLVMLPAYDGEQLKDRDFAVARALEAIDVLGCLDPERLPASPPGTLISYGQS
jgi:hypothetical protein